MNESEYSVVRKAKDWSPLKRLWALSFGCFFILQVTTSAETNQVLTGKSGEYAGSASCRECHSGFYQLWETSHHGRAMQPYSMARTNLIQATNEVRIAGLGYRALVGSGVVVERGATGEKQYPVVQALGGKNVYYFLTPWERGRMQVLPLAYDVRRKEWFDTADSALRHFPMFPDQPLHWTERQYTFNTSCYNCHVSQLTNTYNVSENAYHTTWAEPGINCETCHGPSAEHVKKARETPKGHALSSLGLISYKTLTTEQANSLCGSCHAKILPLTSSFAPGEEFFNHFGLSALEQVDFYADGRDLGENFTYTSWRMSPCLKSGKLTCVTCHTSSGRYRFAGEKANDACASCHGDKVKRVEEHSHHAAGSSGAQCVSCHMPTTEFARMRRSDHSMRPPMPAATLAYGSPNACNLCHTNKDAAWADREVRRWHKDDYQKPTLERAALITAVRNRDWSRLPDIVKYLSNSGREEIWTASLIQLLRGCEDEQKWPGIQACLTDRSPMVRAAAVEAMGDGAREEAVAPLLAATRDAVRLVRIRAAAALSTIQPASLGESDRLALQAATEELKASFQARPDDPVTAQNLGNFYLEQQDFSHAIEAFGFSRKLEPKEIPPLVNLSVAYSLAGQNDKAEASLREALRLEPTNAIALLNLGMLLAETERMDQAENAFRASFQNDPHAAQAAFNLGILLAKSHPAEALGWCRKAAELRPQESRYAYTLAFFQNQQGKTNEAVFTLENLLNKEPVQADAYVLLGKIREDQNKLAEALAVYQRGAANHRLTKEERAEFQARANSISAEKSFR